MNAIVKQSSGTFTGDISVNERTGVISISNAGAAGTHTITIRVTDNCGAITDASFTLTVGKADQTITFGALANKTLGDPDFALSATATSGLPVSFAAIDQCTVAATQCTSRLQVAAPSPLRRTAILISMPRPTFRRALTLRQPHRLRPQRRPQHRRQHQRRHRRQMPRQFSFCVRGKLTKEATGLLLP